MTPTARRELLTRIGVSMAEVAGHAATLAREAEPVDRLVAGDLWEIAGQARMAASRVKAELEGRVWEGKE